MKIEKQGLIGIILAVLVVAAGITYAFATGRLDFVPSGSAIVLPSGGTVFIQVERMNRLETVSYMLESTYKYDQNANSPWYDVWKYVSDQKKLFVVPGQITAGVDLSKLAKADVQIHGKAITLNLPPSQVLTTSLDEQNIQVYDISSGLAVFFQSMDPNLQDKILAAAKVSLQKDACDQGILRQASQNAQQQFTSFLTELGFTSVTVNAPVGTC